jgi:hypothetical protein
MVFFGGYKKRLIFFLIIWLNFMHCIITIQHNPYDITPIHLQACFKWHKTYSSFKIKGKKLKHLKPTYLSNYLTKIKPKIKQFENAIVQKKSD